ncbi:GDP-L-fucose synthase [Verrucomicrobia bacterium]|jgi:GDP-L-fucose synthase|nr:GDP-L-fucose synthase [Verrucomicrobiota bacterium]MDA7644889.1 GDP-L-fucose synthase [bacterium]MDA7866847.1 GDP-L-fucose synthase [Verrucomicrobiota bacterium]
MFSGSPKIFIAGHRGLVGSALVRAFEAERPDYELLLRTRQELDLLDTPKVQELFHTEKPDYVVFAAAKVGGIIANSHFPADFIYDNLQIQNNVIHAAYKAGVKKLLFLGSSCIYPKLAPQPLKEKYLLSGPLEPTNEWYAVAKIAGIKLCQALRRQHDCHFISAMPTNLYGANDNYDLKSSHVLPALMRKFHEAKTEGASSVTCWGTGSPQREFLHVDDLAAACLFLLENYDEELIINVGSGSEVTIRELAELVGKVVGFEGDIHWDTTKPDGTPRKLLDTSRLNDLGWTPNIKLEDGIQQTYREYVEQLEKP